MNVRAEVIRRRNELGITQAQLARRSGGRVTRERIAKLENGDSVNITTDTLYGLGVAFGCAPIDLLPEEFKHPPKAA